MKLIIAGGRDLVVANYFLRGILDHFKLYDIDISEIVSGTAKGIDSCGEYYAKSEGIHIEKFPADWNKHGKAAGHIRNKQMAEYADALLLIWNGESAGSKNMKENMIKLNKRIYEVILK